MNQFRVLNAAHATEPAVIEIYEQIGADWFTNNGITAKSFAESLATVPESQDLIVSINSEGGNVHDGLGIYRQLKRRKNVTCRIDGRALSIASVIAMAGDVIEMPANALMMIHNPWVMATGDAEALRDAADALNKHTEVLVGIYHDRTGIDRKKLEKMMNDETWMTGTEAAELGFCTGTTTPLRMAASARHPSVGQFRNLPNLSGTTATSTEPTTKSEHMEKQDPTVSVATSAPAPVININLDHEKLAAAIAKLAPAAPAGVEPLAVRVENLGDSAYNKFVAMASGADRMAFAVQNLARLVEIRNKDEARAAKSADLRRMGFNPLASNTISSDLVNDVMADGVEVAVHNRLALLRQVNAAFTAEPMKPLTPIDIAKATAAATVMTDSSDFESGNSTLDKVNVIPHQYTSVYQMSNDDLQKGFRLSQLALINANAFADKIHDVTTTLMTAANFGSTTLVVGAATTWTTSSLQAKLAPILAAGKDYDRRVLLLDGGHLAYLLPTDKMSYGLEESGGWGFEDIVSNSRWTGAQTNACGFLSNGRAIAAVSGIPFEVAPGMFQSRGTATTKNGLTVMTTTWFSTKTRTIWASYDIIYGTAVLDATGGRVLITA